MFHILRLTLFGWTMLVGAAVFLWTGGLSSAHSTESATLVWDSNSESDIAGYKLHYGTSTGSYGQSIDVGTATTATVPNLPVGNTYYFVVTAYNTAGLESLPSNEASLNIPIPNQAPSVTLNSPVDGERFITPTNISLSATALDIDGTISRVEFLNGDTKLGEATTRPFIFKWAVVEPGNYTVTARAFDDQGLSTTSSSTSVIVAVPGNRLQFGGLYTGVVTHGENGSNISLTLFISRGGQFTGRAIFGNLSLRLAGRFPTTGFTTIRIPSPDSPQRTLLLKLGPDGKSLETSFTNGTGEVQVMLSPTPYSAVNPAPQAGKYTVLLGRLTPVVTDPQVAIPAIPEGWGFAILVITKNGWVRALGLLADGSTFSGNALLKADAHFAIYLQLPGKGLFAGDVAMREKVGESDGDGSLWWDKPAIQGGRFYPAGFRGTIPVQLSRFDALSFRQQIQGRSPTLIFKATLSGGDLEPAGDPIEKSLTFPTGNTAAILNPGNDRCHLRIHWNTGTIGGSFVHPSDRRIRPIGGVVFQKQGIGAGFFPGRQAIGQFELSGLPGEPTP